MEGGGMHGLGEVQHFLLRPLVSWTHTQNITEEKAQLPSSPGTLSTFIYFLIYIVKKGLQFSRPQPGSHKPNSPWTRIISEFQAGDGKIDNLFYSVQYIHL